MFPFLHFLLMWIEDLRFVLTTWVCGVARHMVDENLEAMLNLALTKFISNNELNQV